MTVNEKISRVRHLADLNQHKFSKLVGIAPSTLARLERANNPDRPSLETLQKIADAFEGLTLDMMQNSKVSLPDEITPRHADSPQDLPEDEGQWLRRFMGRHSISQQKLADLLGVSRVQAHMYTKSQRFRLDVRNSILAGLSKALGRPVAEEEVFGGKRLRPAVAGEAIGMVAVPLVRVADRPQLSDDFLRRLQSKFVPAIDSSEPLVFASKAALADHDLENCFGIEIGGRDRVAMLMAGSIVLGVLYDRERYEELTDGLVLIRLRSGDPVIREVVANNLRTTGILELGGQGTLQARREDIAVLFRIIRILDGII